MHLMKKLRISTISLMFLKISIRKSNWPSGKDRICLQQNVNNNYNQ